MLNSILFRMWFAVNLPCQIQDFYFTNSNSLMRAPSVLSNHPIIRAWILGIWRCAIPTIIEPSVSQDPQNTGKEMLRRIKFEFSFTSSKLKLAAFCRTEYGPCIMYRPRLVEYVVPVILMSTVLNIPKFFETELYYEEEPTTATGNISRYQCFSVHSFIVEL